MKFQVSTLCVLLVLSNSRLCYGGDVALATLKASVKFPEDSSDDPQSKSASDLYATASQQHSTAVASLKLFNAAGGGGGGGGGVGGGGGSGGSHYPYQQTHEESGSQSGKGFYQRYSTNDHQQPLTATTYGPPKPMPYRNSHPSSLATASTSAARRPAHAQVYRHRGVVLPAKLTLPYGQPQASVDLTQKYARPTTDFRKYYKKAPEVSAVRKSASPYKYVQSSITDSGTKFTTSPYKDDYTKSYKKQASSSPYKSQTSDSSNENYSAFGSHDLNNPLPDPFSKEFYDVYYKAKENRYQQQHQGTKPTTIPPRSPLSKYYKKPVNHFSAKPVSLASNSPYKSTPGKVFSDSLDYTRPDYYNKSPSSSLGSSSFSSSSYGGAASALAPISTKLGSSEWTPINAPAGAVPARSYDISPPDLSRSHPSPQHSQHTYQPRHDFVKSTNTINYRTGASSEGIVSADVMVKQ